MNKQWAGDAEVQLVTGAVALLQLLAAAKTDLSQPALEDVINDAGRDQLVEDYQGRHEVETTEPPGNRVPALLEKKGLR